MSGLINWSTDPSSNDIADPPILWQEGQPAPTVNNSAREMMAAMAKWRDDTNGSLAATGAAGNALTVSTFQGFTDAAYDKAFELAFYSDALNTRPCTLKPDGASAKPLKRQDGQELGPSDIRTGVIYRVRWHPVVGAFIIISPTIAPAGSVQAFASESAIPAGWFTCNGAVISRTDFAALFAAIGTTWGGGNGSTTFNLPDLRGRTLFGADNGAGRLTGAGGLAGTFGSTGGTETVALSEAQLASHGHGGSTGAAGTHDHGGAVAAAGQHSHGSSTGAAGGHNHTGSTAGAGAHSHTGSTDAGGAHVHPIGYNRASNYNTGTGGSGVAVFSIYPSPTNSGGATDSDGTSSGVHSHGLTTSSVGDHAHAFTTGSVADHAHSIPADGQHAHTIPAAGDHTHSVSIAAAGGGQAHPNMPPGLVMLFAIKA